MRDSGTFEKRFRRYPARRTGEAARWERGWATDNEVRHRNRGVLSEKNFTRSVNELKSGVVVGRHELQMFGAKRVRDCGTFFDRVDEHASTVDRSEETRLNSSHG